MLNVQGPGDLTARRIPIPGFVQAINMEATADGQQIAVFGYGEPAADSPLAVSVISLADGRVRSWWSDTSHGNKLVDVVFNGHTVMMFAQDLREHSVRIAVACQTTVDLAFPNWYRSPVAPSTGQRYRLTSLTVATMMRVSARQSRFHRIQQLRQWRAFHFRGRVVSPPAGTVTWN